MLWAPPSQSFVSFLNSYAWCAVEIGTDCRAGGVVLRKWLLEAFGLEVHEIRDKVWMKAETESARRLMLSEVGIDDRILSL